MTSAGWSSISNREWITDTNYRNTDDEGWSYDTDFGSFENAHGKKGMMHFVRRRRLIKFQEFKISKLFPEEFKATCDHCDLAEMQRIQGILTQILAAASLVAQSKAVQPHMLAALKSKLISELRLMSEASGLFILMRLCAR